MKALIALPALLGSIPVVGRGVALTLSPLFLYLRTLLQPPQRSLTRLMSLLHASLLSLARPASAPLYLRTLLQPPCMCVCVCVCVCVSVCVSVCV